MSEERRFVGTLQETFIKQISELSGSVARLNSNMEEMKEQQRGYVNLMISVERNNLKVESALEEIKKLYAIHNSCGIKEVSQKVEVLNSRVGLIGKALGALGAGLVPIIYKVFGG